MSNEGPRECDALRLASGYRAARILGQITAADRGQLGAGCRGYVAGCCWRFAGCCWHSAACRSRIAGAGSRIPRPAPGPPATFDVLEHIEMGKKQGILGEHSDFAAVGRNDFPAVSHPAPVNPYAAASGFDQP